MGADQAIDWAALTASTLDWWQEAGVDVLVEDAPRDWLVVEEPVILPPPAKPAPVADVTASPPATALASDVPVPAMPDTIAAFLDWRGGPHAPEAGWPGATILASGPVDAAIMVLVDQPDREDCDAEKLLSGTVGRLFDRMLAAIGQSRDSVHVASVCVKRPAAGRVARDLDARLGEVARAHVALVAPKRLFLMGNAASRAVLGMDFMSARGTLHRFNYGDAHSEAVASHHPRFLIEKPIAKADAWKDLQLLIGGLTE
ncbi:uracil-DNA glycosylase [Sphingomonas sp. Leaf17]|uniref:uracil-DNA glycosylase family protein n=1 Tax=Sphingomonas sp. Leaf17 TaxID=1735683 RepID=UPI0006F770D2|nr:uracil-DNA glycosylase family protein [Sphingomonas sp. Leaf17]KQM65741.1 uracil-DNA glycosylase [Sphingomonas sp. Leaf17]